MILVEVLEELLGAEHLGDAHELVIVVVAVEEGLLAEDHGSQHAAQRPHVQRVVVHLVIHQQLGALPQHKTLKSSIFIQSSSLPSPLP